MKKYFCALISIFAIGACANAVEIPLYNFYFQGFGGINFVESLKEKEGRIDFHEGYAIGGAIGYRISAFGRIEGEIAYRENKFDKLVLPDIDLPLSGDVSKLTFMANALIDIPLFDGLLCPFIGGGLGGRIDRGEANFSYLTKEALITERHRIKENGLAYQGIGGISVNISDKTDFKLEYRYLDWPDNETNHTIDVTLRHHF